MTKENLAQLKLAKLEAALKDKYAAMESLWRDLPSIKGFCEEASDAIEKAYYSALKESQKIRAEIRSVLEYKR